MADDYFSIGTLISCVKRFLAIYTSLYLKQKIEL